MSECHSTSSIKLHSGHQLAAIASSTPSMIFAIFSSVSTNPAPPILECSSLPPTTRTSRLPVLPGSLIPASCAVKESGRNQLNIISMCFKGKCSLFKSRTDRSYSLPRSYLWRSCRQTWPPSPSGSARTWGRTLIRHWKLRRRYQNIK